MLVRDVMTKNPITIDSKASILEAKNIMTKNNINKLPVLDKGGALIGIITTNDLQRSTPSDATTLDVYEMGYLLSKLSVEKCMTKNPKTVQPGETVEEAARIMADNDFGCLPVMENKLIVGIITDSDLFKMFIEMFGTRESGIRVTINMSDECGSLSAFTERVAQKKGKIISLVTSPASDTEHRIVTVKAVDISMADIEEIARECGCVEDIRKI
ncbi:MAG: CBS domain-containing protein [Treponema sp.]|jgi:acetoin utilization protein AcuB|nr:CBS domain-containing protein [Treponema sp.]